MEGEQSLSVMKATRGLPEQWQLPVVLGLVAPGMDSRGRWSWRGVVERSSFCLLMWPLLPYGQSLVVLRTDHHRLKHYRYSWKRDAAGNGGFAFSQAEGGEGTETFLWILSTVLQLMVTWPAQDSVYFF